MPSRRRSQPIGPPPRRLRLRPQRHRRPQRRRPGRLTDGLSEVRCHHLRVSRLVSRYRSSTTRILRTPAVATTTPTRAFRAQAPPSTECLSATSDIPTRETKDPRKSLIFRGFQEWRVRDSNPRSITRLIYSQIPLAARVTRQARPTDVIIDRKRSDNVTRCCGRREPLLPKVRGQDPSTDARLRRAVSLGSRSLGACQTAMPCPR